MILYQCYTYFVVGKPFKWHLNHLTKWCLIANSRKWWTGETVVLMLPSPWPQKGLAKQGKTVRNVKSPAVSTCFSFFVSIFGELAGVSCYHGLRNLTVSWLLIQVEPATGWSNTKSIKKLRSITFGQYFFKGMVKGVLSLLGSFLGC